MCTQNRGNLIALNQLHFTIVCFSQLLGTIKIITMAKHKVFLSYSKADKDAVDKFSETFGNTFIRRGMVMEDDLIDSTNTDYVMSQIRKRYLKDSTVAIVIVGKCTWSRRFVDWEIQSSLRRFSDGRLPNGLSAIQLWTSYKTLPPRLNSNVNSGYSKFHQYPTRHIGLWNMIEWPYNQRNNETLLVNPRDRFVNNRLCS